MAQMPAGASLKTVILATTCLQNAVYTVGRKHSVGYEKVSSSEILLVGELIKLVVCAVISVNGDVNVSDAQGEGFQRLCWLALNCKKMVIVSGIYGVMNILSFVALLYIGSGEFIVIAQLKILSTAVCSVLILGRRISMTKWRALLLLVLGCSLVSLTNTTQATTSQNSERLIGYAMTALEVFLSGCVSVYFESVVKSSTERITIWERNFQLALLGIALYASLVAHELAKADDPALFHNWTLFTTFVAFLAATGGLLVAATLKYADAILKTIATAGAIVLASVLGAYFLGELLNLDILIGSFVVIIAMANYTLDATPVQGLCKDVPLPTPSVEEGSTSRGMGKPGYLEVSTKDSEAEDGGERRR